MTDDCAKVRITDEDRAASDECCDYWLTRTATCNVDVEEMFARHASPLRDRIAVLEGALADLLDASHCYMIDAARGKLLNDDGEAVSADMARDDFAVWNRVAPLVGMEPDARAALNAAGGKQDGR